MDNIAIEHIRESKNRTIQALVDKIVELCFLLQDDFPATAECAEEFAYGIKKAIENE